MWLEGVVWVIREKESYGILFFFFKQKTAYEMCGRDWSSDVCSSDLISQCLYSFSMASQLDIQHQKNA